MKNRSNQIRSNEIRIRRELPVLFSICDEYFMWKGFNSLNVWAHSFSNVQGKTTTKILLHFYFLLMPRYIKTCFRHCLFAMISCLFTFAGFITYFGNLVLVNFGYQLCIFYLYVFLSAFVCLNFLLWELTSLMKLQLETHYFWKY